MAGAIRLTPLGHSCVLIEASRQDGKVVRILLDPGNLTPELQRIDGLDAILITHAHQDHIDPAQISRVRADRTVRVYGDEDTARLLSDAHIDDVTTIGAGTLDIAGLEVVVSTWSHETIYAGIPVPTDVGYFIGGRLFAPGDAFAIPNHPVEVLLLPTGAPWMKLSESIDYMRAVGPRLVVPIHDGGLAMAHREMHRGLMEMFSPEGTTVLRPRVGSLIECG